VRRWLPPVLVLAFLLGAWELAARWDVIADALGIEPFLVPAPSDVGDSLWSDRELLLENAWVTIQEVLAGFAIAAVAGFGFALLLHLSDTLRRALYPLLVASQTVPVIAIAPILVVWLGFGIGPKLVVIALICFFPITVNVLDGLRSAPADLLKLMRSLGASRLQTLRKVELPAALPSFFTGLRVAATVSVIGAVFGEWAGAEEGLGRLVLLANNQLQTPRAYAGIVLLTLMAVALFALATLADRLLCPWNREEANA
jgi:putative hydroxymethylpyrimidine transport system permease protein